MRLPRRYAPRNDIFSFVKRGLASFLFQIIVIASEAWQSHIIVIASKAWQSRKKNCHSKRSVAISSLFEKHILRASINLGPIISD